MRLPLMLELHPGNAATFYSGATFWPRYPALAMSRFEVLPTSTSVSRMMIAGMALANFAANGGDLGNELAIA
jgi:hypothetical protein